MDVLPLIGTLLQYTDAFNYSCLIKVRAMSQDDGQSRALTSEMLETRNVELAQALVRCLTAQPYMAELIYTVALFDHNQVTKEDADDGRKDDFDLLTSHLRKLVYPEQFTTTSSDDKSSKD